MLDHAYTGDPAHQALSDADLAAALDASIAARDYDLIERLRYEQAVRAMRGGGTWSVGWYAHGREQPSTRRP